MPPTRPAEPEDRWLLYLRERLVEPVDLTYTDNTRTMMSFQARNGRTVIRCHRMFQAAPEDVYDALVSGYLRTRGRRRERQQQARGQVRAYIEAHGHLVRRREVRPERLPGPVGRHVDLEPPAAAVNDRWFAGRLDDVELSWSQRPTRRTMGRWHPPDLPLPNPPGPQTEQQLFPFAAPPAAETPLPSLPARSRIVINVLLDDRLVPRYYLDFLLFHELLHEQVYRETGDPRHAHRGLFARREQRHPDLTRARQWEQETVGELWRRHRIRQGLARRRNKLGGRTRGADPSSTT